jgi:hypothetical protein
MPEPFSGAWRGLTQGLQLGGQVELMRERHAALEEQRKLRATQEQRQRLDVYLKSIQAVSQNPELYDSIAAALGPHGITLDPALKTAGEQGRAAQQTLMKLMTGTSIDALTPEERQNPYLPKVAFGSTPTAQVFVDSLKRGRNAQAVGAFRDTVKGYIDQGAPEHEAFQRGLLDHPEVMGLQGIQQAMPARPSFEQQERAGGRLQIQNLMDLWRRGRIDTGTLSDELLSTPGGREFLQAHPEISAQTEEGKALARKRGEYRALTEPVAPGVAPRDLAEVSPWQPAPVPESPFGVDLGLQVPPEAAAPLPSERGVVAPPVRGMDIEAERARLRQRPTDPYAAEKLGLQKREVELREREIVRKEEKDKQVREKVGATIKTMEAQALADAHRLFPGDEAHAVAQRQAYLEWTRNRVRGLQSLMAGDKGMDEIAADIEREIARIRGEIPPESPVKPQVEGFWSGVRQWFGGLFGGGEAPVPGPAPPAGAAPPTAPPVAPGAGPPPAGVPPRAALPGRQDPRRALPPPPQQTEPAALAEVKRLMARGHSRQTAIAAMKQAGWAVEE